MYRIAIANSCLSTDDLESPHQDIILQYKELPSTEQSVVMNYNNTGKVFTTVVAYNYAMEPSKAVCSDGILRDTTPPKLKNIRVSHAKWRETLFCDGATTFLLTSNMEKIILTIKYPDFQRTCFQINQSMNECNQMIQSLPTRIMENDDAIPEILLNTIPIYTTKEFAFIPSDHIHIDWEIDDGKSQIDDFYIGIARYENDVPCVPTLLDYKPTHRNTRFSFHHAGIGSNEPFYILLKAVNKANLQSTTAIGPFLIDDTPPEYNNIPVVEIKGMSIYISWSKDTFYDAEQRSNIQTIYFQFGK
ncbi:hypothetical protein DPMN_153550 [Dreissena polymorpha]|uniref:Uncharacterized protein n=1 Tax=Dreissena polymorpha TaxID=45954 RepID=A0A9D4J4X7_DREPO|nr:hypothetical protein DPMN_153550 [Dreissena polymorpha]